MKFPIPIFYGNEIYTDYEIQKPTTNTIIQTKEIMQSERYFPALLKFVTDCIVSISNTENTIEDKQKIVQIMRDCKNKSLETISIQIMILRDKTNGAIEGVYNCPRCNTQKICENKNGIDTRDFISDIPIENFTGINDYFEVSFDYPVEFKKLDDLISVNAMGFRFPTITDYIESEAIYGIRNSMKIEMLVFKKCVKAINGQEADKNFISNYADMIFNKSDTSDFAKIAKEINKYGFNLLKIKTCNTCGKEWEIELNTNNFFVSGLL